MLNTKKNDSRPRRLLTQLVLTLCLVGLPALLTGCPRNDSRPNTRIGISERPASPTPAMAPGAVAFNGERAMDHVRKQVEIGPRTPGSPELAKTREYIINTLRDSGLRVITDEFPASTPLGTKKMVNITGEIPGESKDVIIISSHYDTKYFKDMRFVGANDSGSSTGTLIELGRVLAASNPKPKLTYWL